MSNIDPRQHSAEHILTAVFGMLFNGKIIDSRFKGNKVRCDFEIETKLPAEEIIKKVQEKSNKIIEESHKVAFDEVSLEDAKKLCSLHRLPKGVNKIRIVKISDDVITPCGGGHVKNTSEIGKLKIRTFNFIKPHILRLTFVIE